MTWRCRSSEFKAPPSPAAIAGGLSHGIIPGLGGAPIATRSLGDGELRAGIVALDIRIGLPETLRDSGNSRPGASALAPTEAAAVRPDNRLPDLYRLPPGGAARDRRGASSSHRGELPGRGRSARDSVRFLATGGTSRRPERRGGATAGWDPATPIGRPAMGPLPRAIGRAFMPLAPPRDRLGTAGRGGAGSSGSMKHARRTVAGPTFGRSPSRGLAPIHPGAPKWWTMSPCGVSFEIRLCPSRCNDCFSAHTSADRACSRELRALFAAREFLPLVLRAVSCQRPRHPPPIREHPV